MNLFKNPIASQKNSDGSYDPSPLTLLVGTSKRTSYKNQHPETKYEGDKPILVVCTDEHLMEMKNNTKFSTGNHPVEMFVPMLHFRDAGFKFDVATLNGNSVKLEMWAFPSKDDNVKALYEETKGMLENPRQLEDISTLKGYSAIFIPGGHGCMINLPSSKDLGRLLHMAHDEKLPTVTLCHGPATLLSTGIEGSGLEFCYSGYEIMCFTDKTDDFTPSLGYIPGKMMWKCQETLEKKGIKVLNTTEKGEVKQDRELITGDSPYAADNLGKFAAPILVKFANEHKM